KAIPVTGKTDAQIATAIQTELQKLPGIGGTGVTSVNGGLDTTGTFDITFNNTLGNVGQLGFAGELPLDFGAKLGDFLGVSTAGTFGLAAILDTGLTFGIDLSPDTAIQIAAPVFTPPSPLTGVLSGDATFDLSILTDAAPTLTVTGGTVQVVTIRNATG